MKSLLAAVLLLNPLIGPAESVAGAPELRLAAGSAAVTLDRIVGLPDGRTLLPQLDLGVDVVADKAAFERRPARRSYADPIEVRGSHKVPDFSGLPRFFRVTVTDAAGRRVLDREDTFCPNVRATRIDKDAVTASRYPVMCSTNPFTRGQVWGIERGWGAAARSPGSETVDLPDGTYTATISVNEPYRALFGAVTKQTVTVTARTKQNATSAAAEAGSAGPSTVQGQGDALRPDLEPLPAWDIRTSTKDGRDQLTFSSTVLNAGPGRMAVDGTRRPGTDIMDSRQIFFDTEGKEVGSRPVGTMEWDPRTGHLHWHFTDFAVYRLLNAAKNEAVRSQKEAFCLANTDGIDLLVRNAVLNPPNTDLRTACGDRAAQTVRQRLDVGWGDTYHRDLPGQSFDVTGLPNGTYYIEVTANPRRNIAETSTANNTSLRQVVLAGNPGARTATVAPVGLITDRTEACEECCVTGDC